MSTLPDRQGYLLRHRLAAGSQISLSTGKAVRVAGLELRRYAHTNTKHSMRLGQRRSQEFDLGGYKC